jgi:RNA polymerase sigma-70 factor (ECF subfamily)
MDNAEHRLIVRAKQGDVEAFEELVAAYEGRVYRLARKLTDDPADTMEVVQDVFLTVYTKLPTLKGEGAFATWVSRIAVNTAYMKLRARRRHEAMSLDTSLPAFTDDDHLPQDVADWSQIPEEMVLREETTQYLQQAITRLPPDYRVVFVLRDMEGLSYREIGSMLELSIAAVKSRLHRARLFLRHQLATYFASR